MTKTARLLRGALSALAALAAAATAYSMPARAQVTGPGHAASPTRGMPVTVAPADEWWLGSLHVPAAWRQAPEEGKGITVAVLSTGVDGGHPDLSGTVTTGPDFSHAGRLPGGQYWGAEGTAVASLIAGHGHGPGQADGTIGVAPAARILSVQVTLEYNDPLTADAAITRPLTAAIAAGIRYAVSHGAAIIALPLDPGLLGSAAARPTAAAGGSPAERAAVGYALAHNVLLVAPAGDNGASTGTVNFPAAYPGVIAVGATAQDGRLSPFTNAGSYVAFTAPGSGKTPPTAGVAEAQADPAAGLRVAAPGGGYQTLASTDMSAALATGVGALIRSRYPSLTAAQVRQALEAGTTVPPAAGSGNKAGWGHGALSAASALSAAARLVAAHPAATARQSPARQPAASRQAAGTTAASHVTVPGPDPGATVKSLLIGLVAAAGAMSAALVVALAFVRLRRRARARAARSGGTPGNQGGPARHARTRPAEQGTAAMSRSATSPGSAPPPRAALPPGRHVAPHSYWSGHVSQRHQRAGKPSWDLARPTAGVTPALPLGAPPSPDTQLPPWEQSPDYLTSPPGPDVPSRSGPSSAPLYVWNPTAVTAPLPTVEGEEGEEEE